MATQTENIGLTKPAGSEKYSLDVNNENLEKIDAALGEIQEAVGTGSGGGLGDKVGNYDDTEAGTVFGDLNIIKDQTEQNGTEIAEVKQIADGNSDKLTALQTTASNTKTVVDVVNTNTETVKQNTETLKTSVDGVSAKVENINSNVSGNSTKLDTIDGKADVISGQVQTVGNNVNAVKTDVASVKSSVDTANTNISSIKTTVESTSEKADTAVELLNLLKAIATTKTKPLICCKGVKENADWQTVVSISGSGVLEKAFARSATSDGLVRITIDDEVVLVTKAAYQDVVGAIKDDLWSSDAPQSVIITSDGGFMWYSINKNGGWYVGFPGSAERDKGCMCVIPGGIRFEKNFKFEVKAITAGVIITGEVSENSVVTTL